MPALESPNTAASPSPIEENETPEQRDLRLANTIKTWIVLFNTNESHPDHKGLSRRDYMRFNHRQLEYNHDFIQLLFPLPERSRILPDAPLIDQQTRLAFQLRSELRENLFDSFTHMAEFYAFDVLGNMDKPVVTPKDNFKKLAPKTWLCHADHNHLRITRIIRCLRVLHLEAAAQAFFLALMDNAGNHVSPRSVMFWKRAAERPIHLPPDEASDNGRGVVWLREDDVPPVARPTEE